jgi:hypothetical protein
MARPQCNIDIISNAIAIGEIVSCRRNTKQGIRLKSDRPRSDVPDRA